MAECECVPGCPFFNGRMAAGLPAVVEMMKKKYCLGSNLECARHTIVRALGKSAVPPDLIPNQLDRATQIIEAAKTQATTAG